MVLSRAARAGRSRAARAMSTASLTGQQLRRRCERLRQFYGSLERQPLTEFAVNDRIYKLPLRSLHRISQQPLQQEKLEYMSGFFDGDGCVSVGRTHPCLTVSQDARRAHILMKFRQELGGAIYSLGATKAPEMPCLKWSASGDTCRQAASILGSQPSMTRAQLQIAAAWPSSQADRIQAKEELTLLKRKDYHPECFRCSWPYFAGFFDADGSIMVRANYSAVVLSVGQANPFVLERLYELLLTSHLTRWRLISSHRDRVYKLECYHFDTCMHTLQKLTKSGLLLKLDQARLVLALNNDNHLQIREGLFELHGKQNRYIRLDADGIARAREIRNLADCCRRSHNVDDKDRLRELRNHHSWKNMERSLLLLRQDIRHFLRDEKAVMFAYV